MLMLPVSSPYLQAQAAEPPAHVAAAPAAAGSASAEPQLTRQQVDSHGYTYLILGNTLLDQADVSTAVQSADDPKSVIAALKKAYESQGHFLVAMVARVEKQRVLVRVVQGRLTHIEGPSGLAAFFEGLTGDEGVRNSDVIRQSILAQAYAATNGKQPQINFKPAPEVGGSTMLVEAKDQPGTRPVGGSLTFGNFGNRYAGHQLAQAQVYLRHAGFTLQTNYSRALTSLDENTRGAYYAAGGATLSWVNPWGSYQIEDQYTKYELGKAFAPLFPIGHIHTWGVSGTQFLYADDSTRWTLSEGVHSVHNNETVFKYLYTLRDQRYLVADIGTDASWRFSGLQGHPASLAVGAQVKLGGARAGSGFDQGTGNPTPHFRLYSANASFSQALPGNWVGIFALSGQTTTDILPSHEQWVLGGLNNLSGYLPGSVVGDRGYLARLSLQAPQWPLGPVKLRPAVFAEYGGARYTYIAPKAPTWQTLSDVGVSLNVDVPAANLSALLAYAKPLGSRSVTQNLRRGQRAHLFFYLQMGF